MTRIRLFVSAAALAAVPGCSGGSPQPAAPPAPFRPEARAGAPVAPRTVYAPPPVPVRAAPGSGYSAYGAPTASSSRGSVAYPAPSPSMPSVPAGSFSWMSSLAEAAGVARSTGRMVFVEEGRPACGNCMTLKNRIIPQPEVSADLGSIAVGYYDDVDANPASQSFQILRTNLPDAMTLPLCGWLTPDLQWVHGYSGGRDAARFRAEIATARARFRALSAAATPAAPARLGRSLGRSIGGPEVVRETVARATPAVAREDVHLAGAGRLAAPGSEDALRAWANDRLDRAVDALVALDYARARAILAEVRSKTAGFPEEREAEKGEVAIHNLDRIDRAEDARVATRIRDAARQDLAGTRWAPLFP
jgi:hypothetical protein